MTLPAKALYFTCGFIAGALLAWDVPAKAETYTVRRCAWLNWDGSCHYTYHRRRVYRPAYRAPSRVYSYERRIYDDRIHESTARCRESVKATGEERYGTDRAKDAALASWMEAVRREPGARYMDPKNAQNLTYECGRSSTGNRASEKASDTVGRFLEQCEVQARPCRADRDGGER